MKKVSLILAALVFAVIMATSCGGTHEASTSDEVVIGNQVWMTKNLNVDKFQNGDPISEAKTEEEWLLAGANGQPAWCYYNNDPANGDKYGKLYNWHAVNDPRGIAPEGWHVPTNDEWTTLENFLGGSSVAGGKMKEVSSLWRSPNTDATNESGFSGLPGGNRYVAGPFYFVGESGSWWSSTEESMEDAWNSHMNYGDGSFSRNHDEKERGLSVRCIKD